MHWSSFLGGDSAQLTRIGVEEDGERELSIEFDLDEEDERAADIFRHLRIAREPLPVRRMAPTQRCVHQTN